MASQATGVIKARVRLGDRVFSGSTVIAGSIILLVLAAVALFLVVQAIPAITAKAGALPNSAPNFWAYVWPLVFGTVWSAAIALIISIPISIGVALFISHYAPRRLAQGLGYVIDLLAAVPSVVFGLWGVLVLARSVQPFFVFLNANFGWIPLFGGVVSGTGKTVLTVAIVLAVMVLPIMTAVCRGSSCRRPGCTRRPHSPSAPPAGR